MKAFTKLFLVALFTIPTFLFAQVPVAKFSGSDTAICGDSLIVNFTDLSINSPTSWKWYFPGATPDTSTLQNPTNIQYTGYGCYTVKLVVKNNSGADSLTDSNYICLDTVPRIEISGGICLGYGPGSITLTALNFHWSNGATDSTFTVFSIIPKTYTIKLYNGACISDTTITISPDTMPSIYFKGDTSICVGDSTVIYALPFPGHSNYDYSYLWNTGSTADSIIVNAATPGLHTYYLTITKGACSKDSSQISVRINDCTGVENYSNPSEFIVYPNPSNGIFQLGIKNEELGINTHVEVYNVLGEKVYSNQLLIPNSQFLINLSSQPNGVYLYRVISETGNLVEEGKIIIQ